MLRKQIVSKMDSKTSCKAVKLWVEIFDVATVTHTRQLIETVRREYEEFIQTTKFEYESFKTQHQQEYDTLKKDFEETKTRLFEEKKQMGQEYRVTNSVSSPVDSSNAIQTGPSIQYARSIWRLQKNIRVPV
jgi:hypothetical protein